MLPKRSRGAIALGIISLVATALVLGFFLRLIGPPQPYDEGVSVADASAMLEGSIPYRNFWTMYAPGNLAFIGSILYLFGHSLLAVRAASLATLIAVAVMAAWLTHRHVTPMVAAPEAPAATPAGTKDRAQAFVHMLLAAELILARAYGHSASAVPVAMLLSTASSLALIRYLEKRSIVVLFAAGTSTGLVAVFRHDLGAYLAIAQMAWLATVARSAPAPPGARRDGIPWLLAFSIGVLWPVLSTAALLLTLVDARLLVDQLILFPLFEFPSFRSLPFPGPTLQNLPIYLSPLVLSIGAWISIRAVCEKKTEGRLAAEPPLRILLLCLSGLAMLPQLRVRPDLAHAYPSLIFALIVAVVLLADMPALVSSSSRPRGRLLSITACVVLTSCSVGVLVVDCFSGLVRLARRPHVEWIRSGPGRGLLAPYDDPLYRDALQWVEDRTKPTKRIYVGVLRHDVLTANEPMFYFMANRRSATRYIELHPGVITTKRVQQIVVSDLEREQTRLVVLTSSPNDEPNKASFPSNVRLLDEYIRGNYELAADFGSHQMWLRKNPPLDQ